MTSLIKKLFFYNYDELINILFNNQKYLFSISLIIFSVFSAIFFRKQNSKF